MALPPYRISELSTFVNAAPAVFVDESKPGSGFFDIVHFQSRLSTGHFFVLTVSWSDDKPSFLVRRMALGAQDLLSIVHTCVRYSGELNGAGRAVAQAKNIFLHFLCTMAEIASAPGGLSAGSVSTEAGPTAFTIGENPDMEALLRKLGYKA